MHVNYRKSVHSVTPSQQEVDKTVSMFGGNRNTPYQKSEVWCAVAEQSTWNLVSANYRGTRPEKNKLKKNIPNATLVQSVESIGIIPHIQSESHFRLQLWFHVT